MSKHLFWSMAIPAWLIAACLTGVSLAQPPRLEESASPIPPISASQAAIMPNEELVALASSDASLNAIAVISEDRLCVVGDRGAILITEDAGRQWKLLPSVTSCNLHGVAFDGEFGFAVGGWIGNVTRRSHGVLLKSLDGGRSWEKTHAFQLGRLTGVAMQAGRIVAWGDYSPELSSSVFESLDGGRSWRSLPLSIGHAAAVGLWPQRRGSRRGYVVTRGTYPSVRPNIRPNSRRSIRSRKSCRHSAVDPYGDTLAGMRRWWPAVGVAGWKAVGEPLRAAEHGCEGSYPLSNDRVTTQPASGQQRSAGHTARAVGWRLAGFPAVAQHGRRGQLEQRANWAESPGK